MTHPLPIASLERNNLFSLEHQSSGTGLVSKRLFEQFTYILVKFRINGINLTSSVGLQKPEKLYLPALWGLQRPINLLSESI